MLTTTSPLTGETLATHQTHDDAAIDAALTRSRSAFEAWRTRSVDDRSRVLAAAADLLDEEREAHAAVMTAEMGKPIRQARAEVAKCAVALRHYAERGAAYLEGDDLGDLEGAASGVTVRHDPIGPLLAIMPWNFPYWQVVRYAAPTLVAGNTSLLKHAPNTTACALGLADLLGRAGLPPGALEVLVVEPERVGDVTARIIADDRVAGVTLTGSARAGRAVAAAAGAAIKPCVLELGGSDPFVVLADADLEQAAQAAVRSRLLNSGQTCISAKRFVVEESVVLEFTERLVHGMLAATVGDPAQDATDVGPLARRDLRDNLADQVRRAVDAGARVLEGGSELEGPGNFYSPTVLASVAPDNPARREETFGPVAAVVPVASVAEAVTVANETTFGLGASVWTADVERARALAPLIDAGSVFVNAVVSSDPRVPFGGTKQSGFGRELGRDGVVAFTNRKTVWVA